MAGTSLTLYYLIHWSPSYHEAVGIPIHLPQVRFQTGQATARGRLRMPGSTPDPSNSRHKSYCVSLSPPQTPQPAGRPEPCRVHRGTPSADWGSHPSQGPLCTSREHSRLVRKKHLKLKANGHLLHAICQHLLKSTKPWPRRFITMDFLGTHCC